MNLVNRCGLKGLPVLEECGDERVNIDARNTVTYLRQNVIVDCRLGTYCLLN